MTGHSIEARIYAEDPSRGFLPTGGRALDVVFPEGEGIRIDSGLDAGQTIASDYDPMIAKLIVHAPDRDCRDRSSRFRTCRFSSTRES